MPVRDVVRFPDPRLKTVCAAVELDEPAGRERAASLAADLLDTMRSFPGCVGIAAPQLGHLERMVAIDVTGHRRAASCHGPLVLVNPQIVEGAGSVRMREGCLSIPDFTGDVTRVETVVVRYASPDGVEGEITCDAYEARVLLHELDHLDGLLFLDRVASARDVYPRRRYQ